MCIAFLQPILVHQLPLQKCRRWAAKWLFWWPYALAFDRAQAGEPAYASIDTRLLNGPVQSNREHSKLSSSWKWLR